MFFFRRIFDGLAVGILWLFLGRKVHGDRVADVVGILLDQALEGHLIGVVFFAAVAVEVTVQMEDDRRPVLRFLAFFEGVFAASRRFPLISLRFAGLTGDDRNRIGDHEGRIEADAELADEVLIRIAAVLGFLQLFKEGFRPRLGNGAEVIHQILLVHTKSVIGNGQGMAVGIGRQVDFKARVPFEEIAVSEGLIMELIDRIGGVRNEFPQENLVICINRVDHQVQ